MNHTTGTFQNPGGDKLHYQTWQPNRDPKAVMVICHGVGEHSGRYMNLVHPLTEQGYAVVGYDHLGCGQSEGQRGHINSWEDFSCCLGVCLEMVHNHFPDLPVFLYGHSMGSLIALDYVQQSPVGLQGLILSGTALETGGAASPWKIVVAKLLSRIWPNFSLELGLDTNGLSRDPQVVQAYEADPLVQGKVSTRWGTEMLEAQARIAGYPERVQLPVLFLHGQEDPLSLLSGAQDFYAKIAYPDKKMLIYDGCRHEPHNDPEHARVAQDLIGWLDEHLP
jgi:alpha-beta hydrolase superfamily lysophospholipase